MRDVNEILFDRYILHAHRVDRLGNGEAAAASAFLLLTLYPELQNRILFGFGSSSRLRRSVAYQRQLRDIRTAVRDGYAEAYRRHASSLRDIIKAESAFVTKSLRDTLPFRYRANAPSLARIATEPVLGYRASAWFKSEADTVIRDITRAVNVGLAVGDSVTDITAGLFRSGRNRLGVHRIEAVVRSDVSDKAARTREAAFAANEDVVRGVQWHSTLDGRTTVICLDLDGQIFNVGEGIRPPAHVNCRSTTVPLTYSLAELDLGRMGFTSTSDRSDMTGAAPTDVSGKQWLARLSPKRQREVLGAARYQLYRRGTPLSSMYEKGSPFRTLTIRQIRKLEGL